MRNHWHGSHLHLFAKRMLRKCKKLFSPPFSQTQNTTFSRERENVSPNMENTRKHPFTLIIFAIRSRLFSANTDKCKPSLRFQPASIKCGFFFSLFNTIKVIFHVVSVLTHVTFDIIFSFFTCQKRHTLPATENEYFVVLAITQIEESQSTQKIWIMRHIWGKNIENKRNLKKITKSLYRKLPCLKKIRQSFWEK